MKRFPLLAGAAMLLLAACNNEAKTDTPSPDSGETKKEAMVTTDANTDAPKPYTAPDSATMMKNWMAYATPGDVHKMMASWDGKWDAETSSWWSADGPPSMSKATCTSRMILGGRYQETMFAGNMMGAPFEGRGLLGYDNATKQFTSTWTDNMGTGVMVLKGTWDEATKSINLKGKMVDASTGDGVERPFREVYKVVDATHHTMEMYCYGPDAKEFKTMEIKLTKK